MGDERKLMEAGSLKKFKKADLEQLRKQILAELKHRYTRNRETKYGSLRRSLTEAERKAILDNMTSDKAKAISALMWGLGLRVGEAVRQKIANVDFAGRRLWVESEKGSDTALFLIHGDIYTILYEWYTTNADAILRTGYLFPSTEKHNKRLHASPDWYRNQFRQARDKAGIGVCYGNSQESYPDHKPRKLVNITSHSCRHYFGNRIWDRMKEKDILVLQKTLRHKNIKNTLIYTHKTQEEIDRAIIQTFEEKTA